MRVAVLLMFHAASTAADHGAFGARRPAADLWDRCDWVSKDAGEFTIFYDKGTVPHDLPERDERESLQLHCAENIPETVGLR